MNHPITIIGGNIAGLSAAWHLARRGFFVTVFESRIWDKPCGGAISREFARYLETELGIVPFGADHFVPSLRFAFAGNRVFECDNFFVVISRRDLQQRLIDRLRQHPNVRIVRQRVSIDDAERFSPQTIMATGFGGFARRLFGGVWKHYTHGLIFRYDGHVPVDHRPNSHLMLFDSRIKGYGWVFLGKGDHVNVGLGGLGGTSDRNTLKRMYFDFFDRIAGFGYDIRPADPSPSAWKIPILCRNWDHPVAFVHNGIEFIGAGDVLGLAHPIIGAGIEPAWQSGWLLGESADPASGRIDTRKYARLLEKNLRLTCRKPIDRLLTALMQSPFPPDKDSAGYLAARLITPHLIRMIRKYPWFAMVHDGRRKTGYQIDGIRKKLKSTSGGITDVSSIS